MRGKKQDVLCAFTERRQCEGHNREPMIEVASEASDTDRGCQVFVGRGNDLNVDGLSACATEATYRVLLDCL